METMAQGTQAARQPDSNGDAQAPLVDVAGIGKRFGALTAVDDVTFSVPAGQVLGFLGPNGAGKSTTMKMITGFLTPDSGRISVAGVDIARNPVAAKSLIGYLPEGAPLYPDMSPRALLGFVAAVRGLNGTRRRQRFDEVVERVHIGSVLDRPIDELSKGFKRRVGLAQAILHDPRVLVLDEPTDGLDPNQKHEVRGLIREIAADKAIILSTHILEEVDAVCDRVVILAGGRIVFDGPAAELEARSLDHNAVTFAVTGIPSETVRSSVASLDGVSEVEVLAEDGAKVRARARTGGGEGAAARIAGLAGERGWRLAELHVERGRLDEVFRSLTAAGQPPS
jgi:ABC-2 type transport system ATP-binding protein